MSEPIDTTKIGKYNAIQNALCELECQLEVP